LLGLFEDEFVGFAEAGAEALVYQVDDGGQFYVRGVLASGTYFGWAF
jgi:hypothetical protein